MTIVYVAFMATVVRYLLGKLAERYDRTGRLSVDMVAITIAGTLFSAFLTRKG